MSIYHVLIIAILILSLLFRGERKGNTVFIILAFLLMFCIQGLRDSKTIGNDSRTSYRYEFNSMAGKDWNDLGGIREWASLSKESETISGRDRNFGVRWLMKLVYDITAGDYQWFIVVVAVIVLCSEALLIQRYSPSPLQSILFYCGLLFFSFQMSATKQSLAMSILLFAFMAIVDKKPVVFIILVLFASFFHVPALIFLPAYWIANMKVGRSYLILLAVVFILTYLLRDRILNLLSDAYYDSEVETVSSKRFLANKVIIMLVIIIAALMIRPPSPEDRVYNALLQLIGVATVIQTFAGYSNVFERLADFYFQFSVIFLPMVFEKVDTKRCYYGGRTLRMIHQYAPYIFCGFAIWRFLDSITNDVHFTPFRFFFQ